MLGLLEMLRAMMRSSRFRRRWRCLFSARLACLLGDWAVLAYDEAELVVFK